MPRFDDNYEPYRTDVPLKKEKLPEPVYEETPELVDLYYKAWELAYEHVLYREDSPQKHYIDEAMKPQTIWIWDTCFMALYCRYAPDQYPGIESLNNFYFIMHDRISGAPFKVHHPDNPPLFAWVEWEYFKFTGDVERLRWILVENKYLQKHFDFIENARRRKLYRYAGVPLFASKKKYGFKWSGVSSGMDNTPRGRGRYSWILWLDLAAQQALSARYIIKIAEVLGRDDLAREFKPKYNYYQNLLNEYYWDQQDGIYYDIKRFNHSKRSKVTTPAAFWPLLADVPSNQQVKGLLKHLRDPESLGGMIPFPTVARNDRDFDPLGQYWRGGVWLPTTYMGIKSLEKYGHLSLADSLAEKTLFHILKTYNDYEPHTIWEAYSPVKYEPSTYKKNARIVRPDFCGWSALGPISLFIENVIGIHQVSAHERFIKWDIHKKFKHGIKNLKFGEIVADLIFEDNNIFTNASEPFMLDVNGNKFDVSKGKNSYFLEGSQQ